MINPYRYVTGGGFTNDYSLLYEGVDEHLQIGRITSTEGAVNYSYSCWIKLTSLSLYLVLGRYSGNTNQFGLRISGTGKINARINGSSITSAVSLVAGTWSNVIVTFDGDLTGDTNRVKLFHNGTRDTGAFADIGGVPALLTSDTTPFSLGALGGATTSVPLKGNMDEVGLFGYTLSDSQCSSIGSTLPANLMTTSGLTQPLHYYRMGDGDSYSTITDIGSAASNNGTMINMVAGDIVLDTKS